MSIVHVWQLAWVSVALACVGALCNSLAPLWPFMGAVMIGFVCASMLCVAVGLAGMHIKYKQLVSDVDIAGQPPRGMLKNPCGVDDCSGHPYVYERRLVNMMTGRYMCCGREALRIDSTHADDCYQKRYGRNASG